MQKKRVKALPIRGLATPTPTNCPAQLVAVSDAVLSTVTFERVAVAHSFAATASVAATFAASWAANATSSATARSAALARSATVLALTSLASSHPRIDWTHGSRCSEIQNPFFLHDLIYQRLL